MKKVIAKVLLFFVLTGCASNLTPEEIEWNKQVDLDNWHMCQVAIAQAKDMTIHINHSHRWDRNRPLDIRSDLAINQCWERIGDHWIPRISGKDKPDE